MGPTTAPATSTGFTADEINSFKQQYGAQQAQASSQNRSRNTGGVKGFLSGLLPLAGGALGAIGGTLLGGPAGTIAGGAAGSAAGEAAKEKIQGQNLNIKNISEQAAFGALPGIGSGIKAIRASDDIASLVKGAEGTAAATEGAAGTAGAVTPTAAPTSVTNPSLAQKVYNRGVITESNAGGFGQGAQVPGSTTQGFRQSEQIAQTLANENIPAGSAASRQIAVGDRLQQHANTIDAAMTAATNAGKTFTDAQKAGMVGEIQNGILGGQGGKGIPGFIVGDNVNSKYAESLVNQMSTINTPTEATAFKRLLDNQAINYGRNSASPDPVKEQIAKVVRGVVNNHLGTMVPEAKAANASYAKLANANEMLKTEAARNASVSQGGEGLTARVINPIQNGIAPRVGKGLQVVGKALGATPGESGVAPELQASTPTPTVTPAAPGVTTGATPSTGTIPTTETPGTAPTTPGQTAGEVPPPASPTATPLTNAAPPVSAPTQGGTNMAALINGLTSPGQITKGIVKQAIPRVALGGMSPAGQPAQPTTPTAITQYGTSSIDTGTPNTSNTSTSQGTSTAQNKNSVYPLQNYLYDVSRDPTHESTYTAMYKELNPTPSASSLDNLTTNQKNQLTGSQNAIAALQGYTQQIQQLASGSSGPIGGTVSALLGKYGIGGQQAANAYALESSSSDVATQIAAGLSSTGRATQGLITQVKESLPKVTDSPQAAQAKVDQLVSRLQATMKTEATPLSTYIGAGQ